MRARKSGSWTLAILTLLTAGCTVGPNYRRPSVPVPPTFRDLGPLKGAEQTASFADLPWWEIFKDPILQSLIRTALEKNYDVRFAAEQVAAARAQLGITRANQFPQISAGGSYSGGKSLSTQINANLLAFTADVNYQLDLFGGLRRATEAARAALLSTEEARRTVVITLVSDIAADYFQLLALDLQLEVSRDTVRTQENSVRLTRLRVENGVATKVDMLQAQQVLDSASAQIPNLQRQIGRFEDAINSLLGNYPAAMPRGRLLTEQYLPPEVPTGLTSALLERRPDIRGAEKTLMSYNARIGVARAAFFPQISLTGALGRSAEFTTLMNSQAGLWTYGASLAQAIFTGGALVSNLRLADSQERQALLSYMQTIQKAFGDVSDALIDYQKYHEVRVREEEYVRDLEESVRLATMRYKGGITTYLEVLDSQRSLFIQQLALAQARGNEYQSLVALYKALGGGWRQ
jgi:outer membrane protein, multidrug efflux system